MSFTRLLITAALGVTLGACEDPQTTTNQDAIDTDGFYARFSPSDEIIPFPNNVLISTTDGTGTIDIDIPTLDTTTCPNAGEIAVKTALNDLDGFSTTAPIVTTFSSAIDSTSLVIGDTVRVFQVTMAGGVVTGVIDELDATEVAVGVSSVDNQVVDPACDSESLGENKLVILPLKPLMPKTSYLVALSNDITGTNGNNAVPDLIYAFTKSTTPLTTTFDGTTGGFPTQLSEVSYGALFAPADDTDNGGNGDGTFDPTDPTELAIATAMLPDIGALDLLRAATAVSEAAIESFTITSDTGDLINDLAANDIIVSWTFNTQSVGDVLADVRATVEGGAVPTAGLVDSATDSPLTLADIYVGSLETTYYLNIPTSLTDDTDANSPTTGSWTTVAGPTTQYTAAADVFPNGTAITIPLMASIPNANSGQTKPADGWPVVIFQHGITGNRTNMLGLADTMAQAGIAVVAIDMPLHGLTGCEASGVGAYRDPAITERTFDVDFKDNATEVTPDADNCPTTGVTADTDPSGTHFINLESLLTSRDNVRQAVADLFVLTKALEGLDYDGGGADFNLDRIHFVGHSLGAMVGTTFLALEPTIKSAVLAMPGGGIAKLLDGSATFGPIIAAGLAANGVTKGYAQYEDFMASAQMALDSADPINYASSSVASRNVLLFEIAGDGGDTNLPDQVIPNNVVGLTGTVTAPLSGTDPLINEMALTQIDNDTVTFTANTDTYVRLTGGHHSSVLTPDLADDTTNTDVNTAEYKAYVEMQAEMGSFIASDGAALTHSGTAADVLEAIAP